MNNATTKGDEQMTSANETLVDVTVTDDSLTDGRVIKYYWARGAIGGAVQIEVRPTGRGNFFVQTSGFDGYRWSVNLKSKYMSRDDALEFAARRWVKAQEWLRNLVPSTYESRLAAKLAAA